MTKEHIYDHDIAPLMSQIIAICKTHKTCTTALLGEDCHPPKEMLQALQLLRPETQTSVTMITVTKEDGSQEITAVLG